MILQQPVPSVAFLVVTKRVVKRVAARQVEDKRNFVGFWLRKADDQSAKVRRFGRIQPEAGVFIPASIPRHIDERFVLRTPTSFFLPGNLVDLDVFAIQDPLRGNVVSRLLATQRSFENPMPDK